MPAAADVTDLADVFGLLADPGRLRVLVALLDGETCVCDLAAVARASESAVSHQLRLLRAHQVVRTRRAGRMAYYRLADEHVRQLLAVALAHVGHAPATAHPEHAPGSDGAAPHRDAPTGTAPVAHHQRDDRTAGAVGAGRPAPQRG